MITCLGYHHLVTVYDKDNFGIHQHSATCFKRPGGIDESFFESKTCKHKVCKLIGNERQYFTVNRVRQAVEHTIG